MFNIKISWSIVKVAKKMLVQANKHLNFEWIIMFYNTCTPAQVFGLFQPQACSLQLTILAQRLKKSSQFHLNWLGSSAAFADDRRTQPVASLHGSFSSQRVPQWDTLEQKLNMCLNACIDLSPIQQSQSIFTKIYYLSIWWLIIFFVIHSKNGEYSCI